MKRIYYIDWLRIFAILGVFFFHNSHFFDPIYWHVKNPEQNQNVLLFLGFLNIWIMPLFFFLSGGSSIFGLRKSFGKFLQGKSSRLLIPFLLGVLFLIPPQKYVEALSNGTFQGGFPAFLVHYFGGAIFDYDLGFSIAWLGITSYHLWFLAHLFIMSVILFPLLKYLDNRELPKFISRISSFRGGVLLMFVPVALVRVLLRKLSPEYTGWCDFSVYLLYYLLGYLFTRHELLKENLIRSRYIAMAIGTVLYLVYIASFSPERTFLHSLLFEESGIPEFIFRESVGALATWSWLIFIAGTGVKYLNREHPWREFLNEAVLPFYILHQTIMLVLGYQIVQWNWNSWLKFGFIALSTLFCITAMYMLLIRPFNPFRFAFGMSKRK